MFATIAAGISLLSALVGLFAWYVKRKKAPTIEERKHDVRERFQDSFQEASRLREEGKHDEAESMLRRLYDVSVIRMPDIKQPAKSDSDKDG